MSETDLLLLQLKQAFDTQSWHGTNLLGSIRGATPRVTQWRPHEDRHNIWEIIVHTAYWKYTVYRRLSDEGRGTFALRGSNWFERPMSGTALELASDVKLLREYHRKLIDAVSNFDTRRLGERPPRGKFTFRELIIGVAAHDLYHAGQIQLLKALQRSSV